MKYFLPLLLTALIQGCSFTNTAGKPVNKSNFRPENSEYFSIQRHDNRALTICPTDSPPSCHDDFHLQAYEQQEVDLDDDGRKDFIAVIKSGLVGIDHDLNYHAVYMARANGRYRRVLFDAFTTIKPAEDSTESTKTLKATRRCHNKISGIFSTNQYSIKFNAETGSYGPPDGDERLLDFCGPYELSFPKAVSK